LLHPAYQQPILFIDPPVDPPVEVARGAHLAAPIGQRIADLPDQGGGRRKRQELHEIDLVWVDVECHIRPQLEIEPQPLPIVG